MSYKVLSRKYRPKIFNEVVGQDNVLTILKSFIESESIPHALIFCGSRGVGKTSLARIFAKTINCNKLNNNIDNLRWITPSGNYRNKIQPRKYDLPTGVYKSGKRYRALIKIDNKHRFKSIKIN